MLKRRQFLKAVVGGAAAAVLPLPAPAKAISIVGNITVYFREPLIGVLGPPAECEVLKVWLDNKLVWSQ